ncbi:tRNA (guanine-N(7)-)-methyltransferase (tRNA(m7G46)-methyltransferase) [Basidiobolus ranarum]|uniref:tRNA (Guanine-N(7)-)-methyltransferase (tRNA(m7G46)-methyltransferase) n=2 Tax=Basidiobolus ranarum TaxID=34480 RepID=A0ABR2VU70_9FUNG
MLRTPKAIAGPSRLAPIQQELLENPSTPGLRITFKEDDLLRTDAIEAVEAALSTIMDTGDASESEETRNPKVKHQAVQFADHPNSDSEHDSIDSSEDLPAQETGVEDDSTSIANNVHLAPPGDLMLSNEISRLTEEIDKINQQEAIVDTLIKKAETSGKMDELRILKKSKLALRREMQETTYQKTQYEIQEAENSILPGRTTVNITSCTISNDGTKDFVLYVIEVHQKASDGTYASGWVVTRRYSEFYDLHHLLKAKFPDVCRYEFPGKRVAFQFHKSFVEFRRMALERYLQLLVKNHDVCKTQEFKAFFCQQNLSLTNQNNTEVLHSRLRRKRSIGFMKHIYQTVAEGIDDMFNGQSTIDIVTHRLGQQVTMLNESGIEDPNNPTRLTNTSVVTVSGPSDIGLQPIENEGITSLTEPLCDLFIEIFELKEKNNWLRRQAVVIVLQQILGGTIERKIKSTMKSTLTDETMATWINMIRDSLWPNGEWPKSTEKRTFEEKIQTKETANRKLSTFFPESLGNMVGRENARRGARRVFTLFQNRRLNEHLVYTILDEVLMSLFPELKLPLRI